MENEMREMLLILEKLASDITEIKAYLAPPRKVSPASATEFPIETDRQTSDANGIDQLTTVQLSILQKVRLSPDGTTAEELREQLGYRSRATVSHNLNDLVRLGFLSKRKGEKTYYFTR
jgi:Fic family protein